MQNETLSYKLHMRNVQSLQMVAWKRTWRLTNKNVQNHRNILTLIILYTVYFVNNKKPKGLRVCRDFWIIAVVRGPMIYDDNFSDISNERLTCYPYLPKFQF